LLDAVQRVTDASLGRLGEQELLTELLNRITEILGTDTAAILLLDEELRVLRARAARGIEEEVERGVQIPVGGGFAGRIAAERRPIVIDDVDHAEILNPILREKGIRSLLGVPLLVEDRVLGVLHVGSLTPRQFTPSERDLLQLAADRAAVAIEHASLSEQRRLAESLQRQILRLDLSGALGASGLEVASRYLPASGESLGGDWYDAFAIGGGQVAMAVGDVVGHGLPAAAVMSQLRTALRAYAADGVPPAGVVDRVNRLMLDLGPARMTTLAYVVCDTEEEVIQLVNAGHPPPLVIPQEGEPFYLEVPSGLPLGVSSAARYECHQRRFETGSTLILYTDGLVEVRGETIDLGLERLRTAAEGGTVEALCDRVLRRLLPAERGDDVALVAARVPPVPDRLQGSWAADPEVLAGIRSLLRRWLRASGAGEEMVYDVVLACQEACANAIEHAHGPGRGRFSIDGVLEDGRVRITVSDGGHWREPRGESGGRGLPLMRALMETVEFERGENGTSVVLERTLEGAR
jgi:serine phosphatase RsbU (regulator of sigma subunit)/anti-sigma regulatory factor (Ser/Thr protein kinase)